MLRFTICLLVAKTAFAANAYPIDNGAFAPVGPETNLVFNFQQIRRDQPSQIELREENIHKYMNRPRTTPLPIDNGDMSPMNPEQPVPYSEAQWSALQTAPKYDGPVSNWKSVPAPPSFPHWDSLAATKPDYHSYENQPIVVTEESGQWHEPEMHSRAATSYVPSTVAPSTFAPMVREPERFSSRGHSLSSRGRPSSGRGHHSSGRGQRKFNWDDVTTQAPTTMPSTNAPTAGTGRMPPPPVPTLSPWYDGF